MGIVKFDPRKIQTTEPITIQISKNISTIKIYTPQLVQNGHKGATKQIR